MALTTKLLYVYTIKKNELSIDNFIDLKFQQIQPSAINIFLPFFNRLIPTNDIFDKVEYFSENFTESTASMAIRTWTDAPSRQSLFDVKKVFQIFENNSSQRFFLTCDSQQTIDLLKNKYANQIMTYEGQVEQGVRNSQKGIQEALINLLLVSKNNKIYASDHSTFSEVAWWLGGAHTKVAII